MALNHVSGKKAHIRNRPTSSTKYNTSCRDPYCCFQRAKLCSKALSKLVTCTPPLHDSPRARKEASQRAKPHTARSELGNGECPLSAEAITCVRRSHTPHANGGAVWATPSLVPRRSTHPGEERLVTGGVGHGLASGPGRFKKRPGTICLIIPRKVGIPDISGPYSYT